MALKALVEFAKMDTSRALYNMRFDLQPTAMNSTEQLSFDRTNWIKLQEFSVSSYYSHSGVKCVFSTKQISTCFYFIYLTVQTKLKYFRQEFYVLH